MKMHKLQDVVLAEELFMVAYTRLLDFYCKNTEELYMDLTERCPDFQNYITLKEMASFLQVTPETISLYEIALIRNISVKKLSNVLISYEPLK